uniref:Poly(A)-specific ribonuclease n=1 Tax=Heterorhabditis bacteriophora TaxID=37862 RepID=A0A1I7XFN8_HETBA
MVDVNERNFRHWLPEIERAIRAAAFISIDLEFLGLPTTSHPHGVSLFDTPTERYHKLCDAVRRFPPCQLGLACFKEGHNGYEVEVFCVSLFKRLSKKVFSFSLSAMSFLSQHKFDFNKFVSEGITYSNRTEIAKLKKEIVNGDIDYDTFADGLEHRIQMLKMRLLLEARDTVRVLKKTFIYLLIIRFIMYFHTLEHTDGVGPLGDMIDSLWDRSLTSIEAAAIIYALTEEYPNFEFQVDHTRTLVILHFTYD